MLSKKRLGVIISSDLKEQCVKVVKLEYHIL